MTRQIIFILTILFTACGQSRQPCYKISANTKDTYVGSLHKFQNYFINDLVEGANPSKLLLTITITDPKVVFIEKTFKLIVNEDDLLKALKVEAQKSGKDFAEIYTIVTNYLSSTDSLTFEYIWTKADAFDDISYFEIDKLGARNLTKKILKETICSLIEKGNFELFQKNKKEIHYYFERVDSDYGGNVKGVFTVDKRLVWICPPFIQE